ncbi:MAG: hypothetical protein DI628_02275 [Blastochloris viridis]|uniref:Uncharacterized protein n=1 Tax=Blastochloris viridis TaxID=1079 RepID=A0A6N4REE4_BLAVI|nr:MAG: hypothetical protein DI628_02275 [Blastochloris viridis]
MFKLLLCMSSLVIATATCPIGALAAQAPDRHLSSAEQLPLPETGPLPVARPDDTLTLPGVGPLPEPRPTETLQKASYQGQEAKSVPLTFESLFLKRPALIPPTDELLTMLANGFGCRFSSLANDSLECPLDTGPINTYVTGTPHGGYLDQGPVMVPVKHRLTLERLDQPSLPPLKGVIFGEAHAWKDRYGAQNLELPFSVEGEAYRLTFRYYDFGQEA